jgi:putative transposase
LNKVMRYSLVWDNKTIEYKDLCYMLYRVQDDVRKIENRAVQLAMEWFDFSSDYKKQYGVYPNDKDIHGKAYYNFIYNKCAEEFTLLQTANLNALTHRVSNKVKGEIMNIRKGVISIPSYRSNQPIPLVKESIKLEQANSKVWNGTFSIFSRLGVKQFSLSSGQLSFKVKIDSPSQRAIIERIGNDYRITESQLLYDEKKKVWYLNLGYSFKPHTIVGLEKERILGIDLGVKIPVMAAVNDGHQRFCIPDDEITQFRGQVCRRRISLLRQGKWCGSGRCGHGRKTKISPADSLNHKVLNFREQWNHKVSKSIIDFAVKNQCGTIQMEDLKFISSRSKFLKSWTFYDLQNKIHYKARACGISVNYVRPSYTSQRCSQCGCIDPENRDGREFECKKCGFKSHADYNAAKNLSIKNIDKIIQEITGGAKLKRA